MSEIDAILDAEPIDADRYWVELAGDRPLVLYGAGGNGRAVLAGLRRRGVEPLAFADAKPRVAELDGLEVLSLDDAAARHGEQALFVACVYNFHVPMGEVLASLRAAGCAHVTSFVPLAWWLGGDLLPAYALDRPELALEQAAAIREVHGWFEDELSRSEFRDQVAWRLDGDSERFGPPAPDQYFPAGVIEPLQDEVFVDAGAFDGDTVEQFLGRNGGIHAHVLALEPDPENLVALEARVAAIGDPRIEIRPFALSDRRHTLRFASGGTSAGFADDGDLEVQAVALDELLDEGLEPTYIKMDIEGAEPDALRGAAETIRRHQPALAVCVYHAQDHLWSIPRLVRELAPDHRLFLRRHEPDTWEVVLYAVPPGR